MDDNGGVTGNLYKDLLFTALIGFLAVIIILIPFINDPGSEADNIAIPPGKIMIEFFWDDNARIDIDGWVKGPKDRKSVGFSNKDDIQFELLRDDRGYADDVSNRNFENFYARGIWPGEYFVNVHWYSGQSRPELEVTIVVTVYDTEAKTSKQILKRIIVLGQLQDKNVFNFVLTADGQLVPDSVYEDDRIILKAEHGVENDNDDSGPPNRGDRGP